MSIKLNTNRGLTLDEVRGVLELMEIQECEESFVSEEIGIIVDGVNVRVYADKDKNLTVL